MSAKTVAKSLRKFLEEPMSFQVSCESATARWLADHGLGTRAGKFWKSSREDARKARPLLLRELEIDSFAELDLVPESRSESLDCARNEKLHGAQPRSRRVAIKAFPGQPLVGEHGEIHLSPRQHLEIDASEILLFAAHHDVVVMVENWEAFERLPELTAPICSRLP